MNGIAKRVLYPQKRKKKLRGFRRFLRDHQQRAAFPYPLDVQFLQETHRENVKLGLLPWSVDAKPPFAIRQLWVTRLVADCYRWHAEVYACYSEFYLAIWLCKPDFGRAQLVAGIEEKQTWYEGVFAKVAAADAPPFPAEYQLLPGVADLHWTARAEITTCWPEDLLDVYAWALQKPHRPGNTADGREVIVVQIGWIWVGQVKTTQISTHLSSRKGQPLKDSGCESVVKRWCLL
jgi:hypothetical protein